MKVFLASVPYTLSSIDKKSIRRVKKILREQLIFWTHIILKLVGSAKKLEVCQGNYSKTKYTNGSQLCVLGEAFYSPFVPRAGGCHIFLKILIQNP